MLRLPRLQENFLAKLEDLLKSWPTPPVYAAVFGSTAPKRPCGPVDLARFPGVTDETEFAEWQVLVEETVGFGRDSYRWMLTRQVACVDSDDARKRGLEVARTYEPEHPMSPQGRRVYQVGDDTWLVEIPGATTNFHFRVSVAHLVDAQDKGGRSLIDP
jgi:hypothetical protein